MKKYKVIEVMRLLEEDGYILHTIKGDHRQYRHPLKNGTVTLAGKKSDTLPQGTLNSIWKQAHWK